MTKRRQNTCLPSHPSKQRELRKEEIIQEIYSLLLTCIFIINKDNTISWKQAQDLMPFFEHLINVTDPFDRIKEYSNHCRKQLFEHDDNISYNQYDYLFSQSYEVFSYMGRALPPMTPTKRAEKKRKTIESYLSEKRTIIPPETFRARIRDVLNDWYIPREKTFGYTESASVLTPKKNGGVANMIRDFFRLGLFKDEGDLFEDLDEPFLRHLKFCIGKYCKCENLHFPCYVLDLPDTGWRCRTATNPPPSFQIMTEDIRNCFLEGMKNDFFAGPSFRNNHRDTILSWDSKPNYYYYSADFSSATDAISYELQSIFADEIEKLYPSPYVRATFSRVKIVDDTIPFPRLGYFLIRKFHTYYWDHPDDVSRYGPGARIFARRMVKEIINHKLLGIDKSESLNKMMNQVRVWEGHQQVMDLEHLNLSLQEREELYEEMKLHYRNIIITLPGRLSQSGQHMSFPLSFTTLSLINVMALRYCGTKQAVCMGDDVLIFDTLEVIQKYHDFVSSTGMILHPDKSYVSKLGGVFCEDIYFKGNLVTVPRPKSIIQPDYNLVGKALHYGDEVDFERDLCLRIRYTLNPLIKTFIEYGYDANLTVEFGGAGLEPESIYQDILERGTPPNILYHAIQLRTIISTSESFVKIPWKMLFDDFIYLDNNGLSYAELIQKAVFGLNRLVKYSFDSLPGGERSVNLLEIGNSFHRHLKWVKAETNVRLSIRDLRFLSSYIERLSKISPSPFFRV